ncbi:DUF167 domain-containing protein [Actomonas aquatica]|uniref:UPF0235 protein K1X11_016330 n=1 Tax=Actomonas aquatica TaxID=2866162 RepID=A0ABZ1C3Y0_9BACT|nr:DUF167 domain-containing protein [Opitutus sp. WL0086]WRQ86384.1 DUF167 domain-containing protein [Opitutus sp. WL0086]
MPPSPSAQLAIKAVPNAARSELVGWLGDALKVKLKAPPVDGKANAELCRFLAEVLELPKGSVTLATGASARQKRVAIATLTPTDLQSRLNQLVTQ